MASAARTLSLPFRVDPTGGIAFTEDPQDQLTQRVYGVLSTQPGERIMRPTYGCDLRQFDFANYDSALAFLMTQTMSAAVQAWEPGVTVSRVVIDTPPGADGVMTVTALYGAPDATTLTPVSVSVEVTE